MGTVFPSAGQFGGLSGQIDGATAHRYIGMAHVTYVQLISLCGRVLLSGRCTGVTAMFPVELAPLSKTGLN